MNLLRSLLALLTVILALLAGIGLFLRLSELEQWLGQAGWPLSEVLLGAALLSLAGALGFWLAAPGLSRYLLPVHEVRQPRDSRELWLLVSLRELAQHAGVATPRLGIIDSPLLNAFSTGLGRDHSRIVLGRGLLDNLDQAGLEAVLAHELAHIQNSDMRSLAWIQGAATILTVVPARLLAWLPDRLLFRREEGPIYFLLLLASQLAGGWLANLLASAYSRRYELQADQRAAALVGNDKLIAALRCLHAGHGDGYLPGMLLAFGISGRFGSGLARLLISHPTLGHRVHALQQ